MKIVISSFSSKNSLTIKSQERRIFKNIVGIGENAGEQHFPLFQRGFLPFREVLSVKRQLSIIRFIVCKCFQFRQSRKFIGWLRGMKQNQAESFQK